MRILAIGDFHGKFPKKFETLIKKEKIDLVVSLGDYPPFHYRKLWFKYCYGKDIELREAIGKKKHKKLVMKDLNMAENSLKKLNKLSVPVYTVLGNIDYPSNDVADFLDKRKKKIPKYDREDKIISILKKYKNLKRFDYKTIKFGDYFFIGMRGGSMPGYIKSKAYKKHSKILNSLFNKLREENKQGKIIFVSHNIAYNTKLDKISIKAAKFALKSYGKNKRKIKQRKRHYGSKMARRIIEKYHPLLHLGGHIHEAWGKDKIGKTVLVNPGAAHEGRAAAIELDKGKVKKIKFIK